MNFHLPEPCTKAVVHHPHVFLVMNASGIPSTITCGGSINNNNNTEDQKESKR